MYILCDHKLGNSLIVMATYAYFKKRNIDVTYVLTKKNIYMLKLFPNIHIPYVDLETFDTSSQRELKHHQHKQILNMEGINEDAFVTHWYAQRMEYLRDAPLKELFKSNIFKTPIHHTVVHIRVGDIDKYDIRYHNNNTIGSPKYHFPVPVQVYDALLSKDEPVTIVSQSEDNRYVKYLKDTFNVVNVISSGDDPWGEHNKPVDDFSVLQACTERLILSCSTFAWCAGISSNAKQIIFPSQGPWHYTNRHKVDLYADDERISWFDVSTSQFLNI